MGIIDELNKQFEELQKEHEKKTEKKAYADMTDAEKLKVKSDQLKKAKARNKELQAKIDFLEDFIEKTFRKQKAAQNIPPKTV